MGGVPFPVVDALVRYLQAVVTAYGRAGVGVTIEAREIAAGDFNPHPVVSFE